VRSALHRAVAPGHVGSVVTVSDALGWLADAAARRTDAGLHRVLHPRAAGEALLDLASND
jgi:hypothetical protein